MNSYGLKAAIEAVLMNEIICLIITILINEQQSIISTN